MGAYCFSGSDSKALQSGSLLSRVYRICRIGLWCGSTKVIMALLLVLGGGSCGSSKVNLDCPFILSFGGISAQLKRTAWCRAVGA